MDSQNSSAPSRARSAVAGKQPHGRTNNPSPRRRPSGYPSGVIHENTRHTTRFTVVGNHLAQHPELSLLAIGLAVHIQSLPAGSLIDIKSLARRFPEGAARIAAALRELEAHGYLRRDCEPASAGRLVTRTISCNQPAVSRHGSIASPAGSPAASPAGNPAAQSGVPVSAAVIEGPAKAAPVRTVAESATAASDTDDAPKSEPAPEDDADPAPAPAPVPDVNRASRTEPAAPRKRHPLPAVPQPAFAASALLQAATDLLTGLRLHDPRLLLSATDTAHLAPGVAAWLEREVPTTAVQLALTTGLPSEGPRRPAALLAHRLAAQLPPPPPFRAPVAPPPVHHPFQTCDRCDRAFRAPGPGLCGECRAAGQGHLVDGPDGAAVATSPARGYPEVRR